MYSHPYEVKNIIASVDDQKSDDSSEDGATAGEGETGGTKNETNRFDKGQIICLNGIL
jgi:hypothetical protein